MGALGDLTARLRVDTSDLKRAEGEAHGFAASFKGALAGLGLFEAGKQAFEFGKESVSAFQQASAANLQLQTSFAGNPKLINANTKEFVNLSKAISEKSRFDHIQIQSGVAQLSQFNLTAQQLKTLTPVMVDYAAKTGKSMPDAANVFGKALMGKGKALTDVGIKFKDLKDPVKNYQELLDTVTPKVRGFAQASAETGDGPMVVMQHRFEDIKESVGEHLVPVLNGLMGVMLPLVDAFGSVVDAAMPLIDKALTPLEPLIHGVSLTIGYLIDDFKRGLSITDILKDAVLGLGETFGVSQGTIGFFYKAIDIAAASLSAARGKVEELWKWIDQPSHLATLGNAFDTCVVAVQRLWNGLSTEWAKVRDPLETDLSALIKTLKTDMWWAFETAKGAVKDLWGELGGGKGVVEKMQELLGYMSNHMATLVPMVQTLTIEFAIWKTFEIIGPILSLIGAGLTAVGSGGVIAGSGAFLASLGFDAVDVSLAPLLLSLGEVILIFAGVSFVIYMLLTHMDDLKRGFYAVGDVVGKVINGMGVNMEDIKAGIRVVADWIHDRLVDIARFWSEHGEQIKKVLGDIWDGIKDFFRLGFKVIQDIVRIALDVIKGNWLGVFNDVKYLVGDVLGGIWTLIKDGARLVGDAMGGVGTSVERFFIGLFNGISGSIAGAINGAISLIDDLIRAWNNVVDTTGQGSKIGLINLVSAAHADTPQPAQSPQQAAAGRASTSAYGGPRAFALGGMTLGPQLAMVGDNPSGREHMTPEESVPRLARLIAGQMGQTSGEINITTHGTNLSPHDVANEVVFALASGRAA